MSHHLGTSIYSELKVPVEQHKNVRAGARGVLLIFINMFLLYQVLEVYYCSLFSS